LLKWTTYVATFRHILGLQIKRHEQRFGIEVPIKNDIYFDANCFYYFVSKQEFFLRAFAPMAAGILMIAC